MRANADGLRAIADALGVPADTYAAEWAGERVPTTEQLAERAADLMRANADGLRGNGDGGSAAWMSEARVAEGVLQRLAEAAEEAGVVMPGIDGGWWAVAGEARWVKGVKLVGALSAAVEVSQEALAEAADRMRLYEEEMVDVERDNIESRETITAAVEKLRGGLGETQMSHPGEVSPPSSRGSTVCGPLFASLRQLTTEVSDVAFVLRRVKVMLEEHNAEERRTLGLDEVSFPVPRDAGSGGGAGGGAGGGGAVAEVGRVLTYEDVVAGVRAKVEALRRERAKRVETDGVLRTFLSAVAERDAAADADEHAPSLVSQTSAALRRGTPSSADLGGSASEEYSLPRSPVLLCATGTGGGCASSARSRVAAAGALEQVRRQMHQAENAIGTMRVAVGAAYEALGGDEDVVHTSDNEAAHLLVQLAQSTADSIDAVKELLGPLATGGGSATRRVPLASLLSSIKEKIRAVESGGGVAGPAPPPSSLATAMEEAVHLLYSDLASTQRSAGSSLHRCLPQKQKPAAPEVASSGYFQLTQQGARGRGGLSSSVMSTLRVLPPPPVAGKPANASEFQRDFSYRLHELDAYRRGCRAALRMLDPSLDVAAMDCNAMVMELVHLCNDAQSAMLITDAAFAGDGDGTAGDDAMAEVRATAAAYRASNPSCGERSLGMRCTALLRAVRTLDNACDSLRLAQENMAKQQLFLLHNEAQNTDELRRALVELEEALGVSEAERVEALQARAAAEAMSADLTAALADAQERAATLQKAREEVEETVEQLRQQREDDADELDECDAKVAALTSTVATLQQVLQAAHEVVRQAVARPSARIYIAVLGREMPPPEPQAAESAHELLLPALRAIAAALESTAEELSRVVSSDKGVAAAFAEERERGAQRVAALLSEAAALAEAREAAELRAKASAVSLRQAEDAFEDEVAKLKRAVRHSEAAREDEEAEHQRRLRLARAAAAEELEATQQRLQRLARAHAEEERLRTVAEDDVQRLRAELAAVEADLAAARQRSSELAAAVARLSCVEADAARAQEAESKERAAAAALLADTRAQLRAEHEALEGICATVVSAGLVPSSAAASAAHAEAPARRAAQLLRLHLDEVAALQHAMAAHEEAQRRRRTRGTQSDDSVAETLAAFASVWAAAVGAGRTPARVSEAWLTPTDKAEVVASALQRDYTAQLEDLAAARQRLLELLLHPSLRPHVGPAVRGTLEGATVAALVQTYHSVLGVSHTAEKAALEHDLQAVRHDADSMWRQLRQQEEQHAAEAAEVELRLGRMRQLVQRKLMADEIVEQHTRETEAAAAAHRSF
ncbi:hypothetical protein NESM_000627800 [Novymonas esmeraldas]|uniref:Uncharacterized protein n=1 Tax=Novymonas esmeraldas TaxID=1808958 RepID=A0AAW0ETK3_9TRYP